MNKKFQSSLLRPVAIAAGALALLAGGAGCVHVVGGASGDPSTIVYAHGELTGALAADEARSEYAVNAAIQQLQFVKISETNDALQAAIVARDSADKKIEIKLKSVDQTSTKITIHVGLIGDEGISRALYDKIRNNLGAPVAR